MARSYSGIHVSMIVLTDQSGKTRIIPKMQRSGSQENVNPICVPIGMTLANLLERLLNSQTGTDHFLDARFVGTVVGGSSMDRRLVAPVISLPTKCHSSCKSISKAITSSSLEYQFCVAPARCHLKIPVVVSSSICARCHSRTNQKTSAKNLTRNRDSSEQLANFRG